MLRAFGEQSASEKSIPCQGTVRITHSGNGLDFTLNFKDGQDFYRSHPIPVATIGKGTIPEGNYLTNGVIYYTDVKGGLDRTTNCIASVAVDNVAIEFLDKEGQVVGKYIGVSSIRSGGRFDNGKASMNWLINQ